MPVYTVYKEGHLLVSLAILRPTKGKSLWFCYLLLSDAVRYTWPQNIHTMDMATPPVGKTPNQIFYVMIQRCFKPNKFIGTDKEQTPGVTTFCSYI